jgi:hypothetical protein
LHRCPYGDGCKFRHVGDGGCLVQKEHNRETKKKGKCFAHKKGKCSRGDDCLFSHDFRPKVARDESVARDVEKQEKQVVNDGGEDRKDCINWKTKGKCRKGEQCPYRHDPVLQRRALEKKELKKRKQTRDDADGDGPLRKERQPLAVRVFGLNYETTEADVRDFFKGCGIINTVSFPAFEDSGRSKGYCGVWFASPKAVEKALALDGRELHGRWLRIQSGKMLLREWEGLHGPDRKKRRVAA